MNIRREFVETKRQTTAEELFHRLHADIISLQLTPGTKLSEVEVAKMYDVSRQPVREAFMRLGDLNLLQIRPQKATLVRKISFEDLKTTRFVRAAVEVEVVRRACEVATEEGLAALRANLEQQKGAIAVADSNLLHELDYEFHRLICDAADCLRAFKTIAENKAHTDRVCTLELSDACGMQEIFEGHCNIVDAITARDEEAAVRFTRHHLAHLDDTLENARQNHAEYFEI